ncbi:hypothetical protein Tco_1182246 [Tanacetum coccineum]
MTLMQAQENGVVLDKERLLFIAGGQDNTFNDDVDEALTMFMANLSSANPIYDEAGPSYDSNILSEVQDHDKYLDNIGEYHEVHEMQNNVQQNYVVDLDAEYTSDSNIIQYEQYVQDNTCCPIVFANEHNKVVNASLTAKLVRYKEQVEIYEKRSRKSAEKTLCEIVEEARIEKPLDNALANTCFYTKRSQELLEYVIGTCPKEFSKRDKKVATTPLNRIKQVTFKETCKTSTNNTHTHVEKQKAHKTNVPVIPSTGVISSTKTSGSKPRSNTKNTRNLLAKNDNKKKVKDHLRNNKSNLKQENHVDSSISYKRTVINSNSVCKTCNKCLISSNHDKCVVKYLKSVNAPPPSVKNVSSKVKQVWKATGKLFANVDYQWKPIGKIFTLGEQCPLTRFTKSKVVPLQKHKHVSSSESVIIERFSNTTQKPLTRYKCRNKQEQEIPTSIPKIAETQTIDVPMKYTAISAN